MDRRDVKCRTKNKFARLRSNFRYSLTDNGPLAEYTNIRAISRATNLGQVYEFTSEKNKDLLPIGNNYVRIYVYASMCVSVYVCIIMCDNCVLENKFRSIDKKNTSVFGKHVIVNVK